MRKLEPIIADDVVYGRAYYEMHEVDAVIDELKGDMNDLIDDRVSSMKLINEKNSTIYQLEDDVAFWKKKLDDEMASRRDEYEKSEKEIRRLKRALWLARAENAKTAKNLFDFLWCVASKEKVGVTGCAHKMSTAKTLKEPKFFFVKFVNVERKCLKKAEEYV